MPDLIQAALHAALPLFTFTNPDRPQAIAPPNHHLRGSEPITGQIGMNTPTVEMKQPSIPEPIDPKKYHYVGVTAPLREINLPPAQFRRQTLARVQHPLNPINNRDASAFSPSDLSAEDLDNNRKMSEFINYIISSSNSTLASNAQHNPELYSGATRRLCRTHLNLKTPNPTEGMSQDEKKAQPKKTARAQKVALALDKLLESISHEIALSDNTSLDRKGNGRTIYTILGEELVIQRKSESDNQDITLKIIDLIETHSFFATTPDNTPDRKMLMNVIVLSGDLDLLKKIARLNPMFVLYPNERMMNPIQRVVAHRPKDDWSDEQKLAHNTRRNEIFEFIYELSKETHDEKGRDILTWNSIHTNHRTVPSVSIDIPHNGTPEMGVMTLENPKGANILFDEIISKNEPLFAKQVLEHAVQKDLPLSEILNNLEVSQAYSVSSKMLDLLSTYDSDFSNAETRVIEALSLHHLPHDLRKTMYKYMHRTKNEDTESWNLQNLAGALYRSDSSIRNIDKKSAREGFSKTLKLDLKKFESALCKANDQWYGAFC